MKEGDNITLKMEATYFSEIYFDFQCVARLYIPEENYLPY
jgi:hypothetical protein